MNTSATLWAPLLLADPSPCLRKLVLLELLETPPDDLEVSELSELCRSDPLILDLLALQETNGAWIRVGSDANLGPLKGTAIALTRLGYLGFGKEDPAVERGAQYLFSIQREAGDWPMPSEVGDSETYPNYSMIPLQTSVPLRGLAWCGYAEDPRVVRAYEWLLSHRLSDGAWPTGIASGNYGGVAGYRRLAHSRWGCRTNTTEALRCLALHPHLRSGPEARQALDLLLGRETRETHTLGVEVARTLGAEPAGGWFTYHARFDHALILDLCWRIGASQEDERVASLVEFVKSLRGEYGLWQCKSHPHTSRWVTFDLLRSLSRLDDKTDWVSLEPRTPFRAYAKRARRY
ncbi:MAG: hypothetical protein GTO14_18700 [Anaerolineales bacterium]|nr:hypothetical protein [Anaerolineales bacterium]